MAINMKSSYGGYMGKVLDIHLGTKKCSTYEISDRDRTLFIGGRFLSTKILWDELPRGVDPLSPENLMIIMTSPLTGTGAPSSSRYDISAKSPLTGAIGHSNSGGNFGIFLKKAGYDGIIIRGKSKEKVYIEIINDKIMIKNADHLWGLDTEKAQEAMGEKKGGRLVIGPAGENGVKFASIVSQERSHGRTGMGAVMGSKNLKGLFATGNAKIKISDKKGFKTTVKKWVKQLKGHPATGQQAPKYGTAVFLTGLSKKNALPTKNFSTGSYDHADMIGGEALLQNHLIQNYGCTSCPIRCGRVVHIDGEKKKGPEYEILCLLGSNLLIDDLDAIIRWNYELDLLGMDSVSTGTVLGFAAELSEKGIWKSGIEFGKKENISETLTLMATREGIGKDLSEGVKFLSEKYGGQDFAPHSKGLEFPAYEPRASVGHGLGYATASRGACHLDGGYLVYLEVTGPVTLKQFHYRSKPSWVVLDQDLLAAVSAFGNCLFTSWTFVPNIAFKINSSGMFSKLISFFLTYSWPLITLFYRLPPIFKRFHLPMLPHSKAIVQATGMEMDLGKMMQVGARGYTLERLFNIREGFSNKDDTLSKRFTNHPLIKGNKHSVVKIDKMLPGYYKLRGWNKKGVPNEKTLEKLGIDFIKK
jgi:aldehyde:ferredoxin oxidoreductase